MRYPVAEPYVITQGYSSGHPGLDIAPRPAGTKVPLYAVVNGVIQTRSSGAVEGNYLFLQGDNGFFYYYGHLDSFSVALNQRVTEGQKIGVMGTTGQSSGVHVHFEVRTQRVGGNVNPATHLSNANQGGEKPVIIPDADNWYGRMRRLHQQVRGRDISREDFRKYIVGVELLRMIEIMSDDAEADRTQEAQNVGQLAVRDGWQQRLVDAEWWKNEAITNLKPEIEKLNSENKLLTVASTEKQKQIDELKAQLAVQSDDTKLLNGFGEWLQKIIVRLGLKKG